MITFDGDGTLWDFEHAMREALKGAALMLAAAGGNGPAPTVEWLKGIRDGIARQPAFRDASMEVIRLASFEEAVRLHGIADSALALDAYREYMRLRFDLLRPYPDVRDALAALSKRYRLALVSNGNTTPERIGLAPCFEVSVLAQECGHRKPDAEIYRQTARLLAVAPESCLHVGDDLVDDVAGASAAGFHTAWLDRSGTGRSGTGRRGEALRGKAGPDLVVDSLDQLIGALPAL